MTDGTVRDDAEQPDSPSPATSGAVRTETVDPSTDAVSAADVSAAGTAEVVWPVWGADPQPRAASSSVDEVEPEVTVDQPPVDEASVGEVEVEPEPVVDEAPVGEAEPAPVVDEEPEPEPEVDGARVDEPEPEVDEAPVVEAEPEVDEGPAAEPEPVASVTEAAPVVERAAPAAAAPQPPVPAATVPVRTSIRSEGPTPASLPVPAPVPAPAAQAGPFAPVGTGAPTSVLPPIPAGPVPSGPARPQSPLDEFADEGEGRRRRWPRRVLVTAGAVVVLGGAYVGASYALADKIGPGATVAGVDIGGLSSDEAVARLHDELGDATSKPIPVVANDVQATIDPTTAGLTFDAEATVATFTGVDLADPSRLWRKVVGEGEHAATSHVDRDKLAAAVEDLTTSLSLDPVDGTVVFVDAAPRGTDAVDGWALDADAAIDVLAGTWVTAARPVALPTTVVEPAITQAKVQATLAGPAKELTSGPVSVLVSERLAVLPPATLAASASFTPTDGNLVLALDGDDLAQAVLTQLPDLLTKSADAKFEFQGDVPVIVPGVPGTTLDPKALAAAVSTASTASDRTAKVDLVQADPNQSTAELEALGVKEIVSEFSTPLTSEPRRTTNIANGAAKISGTLIRPGETFSLTDALGPVDAAHGFVEAGAIVSGEHTDAWGGGLSQLSTTTFNAAYLAGMEDVAHTPHSEWFSRYPEGREATIFTGSIDMKWKNNTPYGALVQAWVADGRTYVRLWGTKHWTVESTTSGRSGVVAPTTVYSQSKTCEASAAGNPGFTVTVTRKTLLNGEVTKTESRTTRYKPQNKVVCGPPPTAPADGTAPPTP